MPFKGVLKRGAQVQITVVTPGTNNGPTATTISTITKLPLPGLNAEIVTADVQTAAPNAAAAFTPTPGNNVVRMAINVSPTDGGTGLVKVIQDGVSFEDQFTGDAVYVYDVTS